MEQAQLDRIRVAKARVHASAHDLLRALDHDIGDGLRLAWRADECAKLTRELRRLLREQAHV